MNVKKAILLVEPDHEFRKTMGKTLEGLGYRVLAARDGHEALDILPNSAVDLIISALKMPNVDGKELLEEINRAKLSVPVIFLTAYGDVESYMDLMNKGAFDYLNKPVTKREILRVAGSALGERSDSFAGIANG